MRDLLLYPELPMAFYYAEIIILGALYLIIERLRKK